MRNVRVGLVGNYDAAVAAHRAIPQALDLAAAAIGNCQVQSIWLPTQTLAEDPDARLSSLQGLWCVPASPYASMQGALEAIRFARHMQVPFLGTCGGFQHALIEYARNVLELPEADHQESNPGASCPLISHLSCSLVEKEGRIFLQEGSRVRGIYERSVITETYHCNFGLNRSYEPMLKFGLQPTGRDEAEEVRVVELEEHPFFIATLFQPERSALRGEAHPLIRAYVEAILRGDSRDE